MKQALKHILVVFLLLPTLAKSQGVDSLFSIARNYAFNGERDKARNLCDSILLLSPEYSDVRILKGRTYSWDGKRQEARVEFNKVLAYDSTNLDAWLSLTDAAYWDDKPEEALGYTDKGLSHHPKNTELMIKRTKALTDLKEYTAAKNQIKQIKTIDTACTACKPLEDRIYRELAVNHVSAGFNVEYYTNDEYFYYEYLQVGHRTKNNNIIFRVNFNQRFGLSGAQFEVDMYPSLGKKMYAYLNYGRSGYDLFPKDRVGLEIYRNFKYSLEGSLGGRYMNFGEGSQVFIITASLTKYLGNYAFIGRTFITPDPEVGRASISGLLGFRSYTLDQDNFLGFVAGGGYSPDNRTFSSGAGLSDEEIYYLQSYRGGLIYSKTFNFKHLFVLELDYRYQEFPNYFSHMIGGGISYRLRF